MIIVDYSQTSYACLFAMPPADREEDLLRHVIYTTVLATKRRFQGKGFGRVVIAADAADSWRRRHFQHYKARRRKSKEEDDVDWKSTFEVLNTIRDEFRDYFPYKYIRSNEGGEADDVVAQLVRRFPEERHVIVSSDKDFKQLHGPRVSQYDPLNKRLVGSEGFDKHEFILRGDSSDGIPNVLSDDDTFVSDKRQKPLTKKKIQELRTIELEPESEHYERFVRNKTLMDLDCVPDCVREDINNQVDARTARRLSPLFDLFRDRGLKRLMERVNEFEESNT